MLVKGQHKKMVSMKVLETLQKIGTKFMPKLLGQDYCHWEIRGHFLQSFHNSIYIYLKTLKYYWQQIFTKHISQSIIGPGASNFF